MTVFAGAVDATFAAFGTDAVYTPAGGEPDHALAGAAWQYLYLTAGRACGRARHGRARDVTPGDYFEIIVRQTSGSTKNVAADELTWFAVEPTSTE